ncbi:MAG: NTP transferase domain-containing protein [Candidatus Omnitrophica bacterium]|nr:NTP transferase domain-containing protein [Candidatus Omnitrophota bacterium]
MVTNVVAVVLAAGKGKRMNSDLPKVVQPVSGRPIISHILDNLKVCGIKRTIVVVGHRRELIKPFISGAEICVQKKIQGTADALREPLKKLKNFKGTVLVIAGDAPLVKVSTIKELIRVHENSNSAATILAGIVDNPKGYGRLLRDRTGKVIKILEETELDERLSKIGEINSGIYCFNLRSLSEGLKDIRLNPRKKEYYLTDIIAIMARKKEKLSSFAVKDGREIMGINNRCDLARASSVLRRRLVDNLMLNDVTIVDPDMTYIEAPLEVGRDTVIFPFTVIEKNVIIGKNCRVGPFCHLREGTVLDDDCEVGNFVEVVRSRIGKLTKAKHLSYLGDVKIGKSANIGAGTIIANFDGKKKNKTFISDDAFIGSGSILVAPVKIGKGAITGAGAVVKRNSNIPAGKTAVGVPAYILKKEGKNGK